MKSSINEALAKKLGWIQRLLLKKIDCYLESVKVIFYSILKMAWKKLSRSMNELLSATLSTLLKKFG